MSNLFAPNTYEDVMKCLRQPIVLYKSDGSVEIIPSNYKKREWLKKEGFIFQVHVSGIVGRKTINYAYSSTKQEKPMNGEWKTTKEHYFSKDGAFGSRDSVCGQVSDSVIRIKCKVCEGVVDSGKNRQLELGEEDDTPSPE